MTYPFITFIVFHTLTAKTLIFPWSTFQGTRSSRQGTSWTECQVTTGHTSTHNWKPIMIMCMFFDFERKSEHPGANPYFNGKNTQTTHTDPKARLEFSTLEVQSHSAINNASVLSYCCSVTAITN